MRQECRRPVWDGQSAISAAVAHLFTHTNIEAWHTFWFWSHWAFVLVVLAIIAYTRYFHMFAAVINDILLPERKGKLAPIDLKDQRTFAWAAWIISPRDN